jgi:hypothetical protein
VNAVPSEIDPSTNAYAPTSSTSVAKLIPGHTTIAIPKITPSTPRMMSPRELRESESCRFSLIVCVMLVISLSLRPCRSFDRLLFGYWKYRAMSAAA